MTGPVESEDRADVVYHYLENLGPYNLWPLTRRFQSSSIEEVLRLLREFEDCSGYPDCACHVWELGKVVVEAISTAEAELKGLCLSCVRK